MNTHLSDLLFGVVHAKLFLKTSCVEHCPKVYPCGSWSIIITIVVITCVCITWEVHVLMCLFTVDEPSKSNKIFICLSCLIWRETTNRPLIFVHAHKMRKYRAENPFISARHQTSISIMALFIKWQAGLTDVTNMSSKNAVGQVSAGRLIFQSFEIHTQSLINKPSKHFQASGLTRVWWAQTF